MALAAGRRTKGNAVAVAKPTLLLKILGLSFGLAVTIGSTIGGGILLYSGRHGDAHLYSSRRVITIIAIVLADPGNSIGDLAIVIVDYAYFD